MTGNGEVRDARKGQPGKPGGCKLGRKQEAAIAALLTERTHADAAAKAGISEATLARWLRVPAFIVAYRAARLRVVEAAIARLQRATGAAVRALTRNLRCGFPSAAGGIVSGRRQLRRPAGQPFALPTSASTARRIAAGRPGHAATTRARFGIPRATAPSKRGGTVPACGQCASASCFPWPSCQRRVKRSGKGGSMR
jgi:hypothetical protein